MMQLNSVRLKQQYITIDLGLNTPDIRAREFTYCFYIKSDDSRSYVTEARIKQKTYLSSTTLWRGPRVTLC